MRSRILIIVQNLPVPFDRRVWLECQALKAAGYRVAVVCPKGTGDPGYQVIDGVEIYKYRPYAPGGSKLGFVAEYAYFFAATAWQTLKARLKGGRFAVIQACNPPDIFWPIALAFRLERTKFIFDHHDLCPELFMSRFEGGLRLPYRGLLWLALHELVQLSTHRDRRVNDVVPPWPESAERPEAPGSATPNAPARSGDRPAGRRHASQSRGDELLRQHGSKFASFSAIGGGVFIAGLMIQAVLTSGLDVPSFASYVAQAVVSVEASYFLNRWFTWKGVKAPFWASFLKYNLQKVVTVTLNLILYGILLKLGMEYLLDNILLTVIFTFVNYIGADRIVFLRGSRQMVPQSPVRCR